MWTIVLFEDGKETALKTLIDDLQAVKEYKTLIEQRHTSGGIGYKQVFLQWIEF